MSHETETYPARRVASARDELAAEESTQRVNRQEEAARGIDPSGAVKSQAAGGNDVVNMRMMLKVLTPGVKNAEKSDIRAKVLRIASQFEHRRGARAIEPIVKQPLVLENKSGNRMRQRKDNVEIRNGQQFRRTRR